MIHKSIEIPHKDSNASMCVCVRAHCVNAINVRHFSELV